MSHIFYMFKNMGSVPHVYSRRNPFFIRSSFLHVAVEGELLDSGLSAFNEDQDLFLQLARSIVEPEAIRGDGIEHGISHPYQAEEDLDRYLSPEEADMEEEAIPEGDLVLVGGNGKVTPSAAPLPQPIQGPKTPPHCQPDIHEPLLTEPTVLEQLTLF